MSASSNAEVAKEFFDKFLADDVDGMMAMQTDDIVWNICPGAAEDVVPYYGVYRGREGCLKCLSLYGEAAAPEVFEITGHYGDADKAFVTGHEKVLAKPTGKTFESPFIFTLDIRDGKVAQMSALFDSAALKEAFSK